MQETRVIPAQTPAWAVFQMSEVLPLTQLAEESQNDLAREPASARLLDTGRKAVHDLDDVRRVNASLFPRILPQIANLAYAGVCLEAREAGGDYYDFFDRGPHRLGFAVGDVSGKGVASALLRATLQASLRTLCSMRVDDLERSLGLVNRLLFESSPGTMYATMFFAEYDEQLRRLQYVNCGHPAALLHTEDGISRLHPTSTVLGLFNDWQCSRAEIQFDLGDTLLLYTDGVTEAMSDRGEEFGEGRLAELLQKHPHLPLSAILQKCLDDVCRFSGSVQCDDLTLVAFRCVEFVT